MNRQNWKEEQKHIKQRENCRGLVTVFLLITKPTALTVARCSLQILLFQNIYLVQAGLMSQTDRREQSDGSIETDPNRTHKWNHTKEEQLHKSEAQSQQINPPERSRALLNGAWYKLSSTHAAAGGSRARVGCFQHGQEKCLSETEAWAAVMSSTAHARARATARRSFQVTGNNAVHTYTQTHLLVCEV